MRLLRNYISKRKVHDIYSILVKVSAQKSLNKLPTKIAEQIVSKIRDLEIDPIPLDAKKLSGAKETYRIRVRSYRIVYQIVNKELIILILRIAHRKNIYK